ncbi:hypothetical protein IJ384_04160 [bacterium]|nr:hypothetical protein [bacterium]
MALITPIIKCGTKYIKAGVDALTTNPNPPSLFRNSSEIITDSFKAVTKFDDIWDISRFNGRICFLPKIKGFEAFDMPEYLYHITSKTNFKKIQSSNTLRRSLNEQLTGVYLLDAENFLKNYGSVGANQYNLCKSMLKHVNACNKGNSKLVVIKIPAESLARNGNIRIRTQEDFFYFQDKVLKLQKDLKQKLPLRLLHDDKYRIQFEKYVLDNGLMTRIELDKFMSEMRQKIHQGYSIHKLSELEKTNAVEYIYNKDITPDIINGIQCKEFSFADCFKPSGEIDLDKLRSILM